MKQVIDYNKFEFFKLSQSNLTDFSLYPTRFTKYIKDGSPTGNRTNPRRESRSVRPRFWEAGRPRQALSNSVSTGKGPIRFQISRLFHF